MLTSLLVIAGLICVFRFFLNYGTKKKPRPAYAKKTLADETEDVADSISKITSLEQIDIYAQVIDVCIRRAFRHQKEQAEADAQALYFKLHQKQQELEAKEVHEYQLRELKRQIKMQLN